MQPNVTVTAAATSRMLCKRADVKTQLDIASTDTSQDARIDGLIIAASEQIAAAMQSLAYNSARVPWLQTYLEKTPGPGGTFLRLSNWPIKGDPASVTLGTGSSPSTVTASTYSVAGPSRDRLYRATGWNLTQRDTPGLIPAYGDRALDYNVTYTAGWIMPDEITEWSGGASVAASAWFSATDVDEPFIFQADATGGTTHASTEPTWPTVEEGTVTDNGITWTAYAQRLPRALEEAALMLTVDLYDGAAPSGIKSEAGDGYSIVYKDGAQALSRAISAMVGPYA